MFTSGFREIWLLLTLLECITVLTVDQCPRNYKNIVLESGKSLDWCYPNKRCANESEFPWITKNPITCQLCSSKPLYTFYPHYLVPLKLEYTSSRGDSNLLLHGIQHGHDGYNVLHKDGYLRHLPNNMCNFPDTIVIDFSNNHIKTLVNLSCLHSIDVIKLSGNDITELLKETLNGMVTLRELDLSHNKIKHLDPNTIGDKSINLLNIKLSHNLMTEVDITNFILERPFCDISYSNSPIKTFTNELNRQLDENKEYFGGMVHFQNTDIRKFPDFQELGVHNLKTLGKIFTYGFDLRGALLICDCSMEPILAISQDFVKHIWRDYFDVKCSNPPELRGNSIPQLVKDGRLDLFICNISTPDGCDPSCNCYNQPSNDRIVVNCSGADLDQLPKRMPEGRNLEILLPNNDISKLENKNYFNRTKSLDLSNNSLIHIDEDAFKLLKNATEIKLSGNPSLKKLPASFQSLDQCVVHFDTITVECTCDDLWIGEWSRHRNVDKCPGKTGTNDMYCKTNQGDITNAKDFDKDLLGCNIDNSIQQLSLGLAISFIGLVIASLLVHRYRYEFYLLYRMRKNIEDSEVAWKYDAYLSCNESEKHMSDWILNEFVPELENNGYRLCVPCRDFGLGEIKTDEITNKMAQSANVIIMLSEQFLSGRDPTVNWYKLEWMNTLQIYRKCGIRKVIIINFDLLRSGQVGERHMQAFLRLRFFVDFVNQNKMLMTNVKTLLGSPLRSKSYDIVSNFRFNSKNL